MIIAKKIKAKIPQPALLRLCKMYALLDEMLDKGEVFISSNQIGDRLGVGSHNIRKDIGFLKETGTSGSGYEILKIRDSIKEAFGFEKLRNACIIGLGSMGSLIINNQTMPLPCFTIAAGFDSNINILETVKTAIPVYPTYEIPSVLKKYNIEIAIIAEKNLDFATIFERLKDGGIKAIINFTPVLLNSSDNSVYIRNIDLYSEFRYLSALMTIKEST